MTKVRSVNVVLEDGDAVFSPPAREVVEPIVRQLVEPNVTVLDGVHDEQITVAGREPWPAGAWMDRRLAHVDRDGNLCVIIGLLPRIERALATQGVRLVRIDRSLQHWREWRDPLFREARRTPAMTHTVEFLYSNKRGQIRYRRNRDRDQALVLLARLYRGVNVFIVTPNRQEAERIVQMLEDEFVPGVVRDHDRLWQTSPRVYVAPWPSLQGIESGGWEVIVFAGFEIALARKTLWMAAHLKHQVQFTFVHEQTPVDADDRFWLDAIFGEAVHQAVPFQHAAHAARVLAAASRSDTFRGRAESAYQRKQDRIWNNMARNEVIARTALAFRMSDLPTLKQLGLLAQDDDSFLDQFRGHPRVAVLVEVPAHGRLLLEMLPDWNLSTWPSSEAGAGSQAVCTFVWADRHGIRPDILIRADGTASPWSTKWGPHHNELEQDLLIVDFMDHFDSQSQRDSRRRLEDYQSHGWDISLPATTPTRKEGQQRAVDRRRQAAQQ